MNALTEPDSRFTNLDSRPTDALTARQWSTVLGITMRRFNQLRVPSCEQRIVRGGITKFYAFADLPEDRRLYIIEKQRELRCLRPSDLLDSLQRCNAASLQRSAKPLTALPPATQAKAFKVRDVL